MLNLIVSDAVGLEDGVVYHYGEARLRTPRGEVALRPGQRYVVEGRHCVVTGYATNGAPLDLEIYYGNYKAAAGRGSVATYCLEGAYRVRYRYYNATAVAKVDYSGEAGGNVTLKLAAVTATVVGPLGMKLDEFLLYAPPGYRLTLSLSRIAPDLKAEVVAEADRHVEISIFPTWGVAGEVVLATLAILAATGLLIKVANPRYLDEFANHAALLTGSVAAAYLATVSLGLVPLGQSQIDQAFFWGIALVPGVLAAVLLSARPRKRLPGMLIYLGAAYLALYLLTQLRYSVNSWLLLFALWGAVALGSISHFTTIEHRICKRGCWEEPAGEITHKLLSYKLEFTTSQKPEDRALALWKAADLYLRNTLKTCGVTDKTSWGTVVNCAEDAGLITQSVAQHLIQLEKLIRKINKGAPARPTDIKTHCLKIAAMLDWGQEPCLRK